MQFLDTPRIDLTSIAPGDAPGDDDPYEKRIALVRELEGVELANPNKEAADPGHLYELKQAFRKRTEEIAAKHPDRAKDIALPEFSTLGEIAGSSLDSEDLTHSYIGKGLSIERAYDEQIKTIKQLTGKELPNPVSQAGDPGHYYELKEEFKRQAEELAEQNPELRNRIVPLSSIDRSAGRIRDKGERHAEEVWERSEKDTAAWIARIGGGFYSFLHDPVQLATSAAVGFKAAGAGVKGLLWMGLKQGAANAGAEAVMQPFVQQWRKEAGMDYGVGRAAQDIAFAGAFGVGMDVGLRSTWRGFRRAAGRPYLGPDTEPSPGAKKTSGAEPSGATLPGLPEGKTAPSEAPSPRIYRGPDPIPPMEALEQAARNAPEGSVLRRAADGDEAALRELAKELGADADPAIRRALDELELEKLFPTPLNVDDGAHLENLARAIRAESGAADLPAGDAIRPLTTRQIADIADETVGRALEIEGRKVDFRGLDPRQVTTDASTFQFKSGGDSAGVTDRLRGVTRWDPVSAGKAIVFERADGQMVIADGHQRLGLAQRTASQGQDAKLDAYVFREADGWTPEDVRAYAALKNMRESSGTSVDMAQVMRDRPDLIDGSLPLTDAKLKEAAMLARLSPEAFDAVVAGRLPPSYAALIGESVADSTRHGGLLDEMAAADLANTQQARLYLKEAMQQPSTVQVQQTIMDARTVMPTALDREETLHSALVALRKDKRILNLVGREVEARTPGRDLNRAQSLERFMAAAAERLANAEMRIKGAIIGARSVEIDLSNLRRMNEKAQKLRAGFDDRSDFRKTVDKLLFFGDPQDIRNLRAERLEHRRDATMRTARQLQQDYDIAAAEADGILTDLENLKVQRDIALGLTEPSAASALPSPEQRAAAAKAAKQLSYDRASQLADFIEKQAASPGPVADMVNAAAAGVARGLDPKMASRAFVDRIADVLEREGLPGLTRVDETLPPQLAPVRMEDPLGPEAKAQVEDINWALELDDEIKFAIRAYHGTPHDFDRFDLGRIGTGEGAQVFGHGLYFAEAEGVAKAYREALSPFALDGVPATDPHLNGFARAKTEGALDNMRDETVRKIEMWEGLVGKETGAEKQLARFKRELEQIDLVAGSKVERSGQVYEVDLDAEPHQLLDYDTKLADQPEMLAKVEKVLRDSGSDVSPDRLRTQPGSWAYSELEAMLGSADAASRALKDAGIPGLRYLDQGSRDAGDGTRNIVIFDDGLIKITKKNGEAVSGEERQAAVDAMFGLRGFYSPAIRAAESISMKKGTGEQFWKQITKTPGVRKDELEWMGLEEFLAGKPSVTRDEVLGFMRVHQVELDEKALGGKSAEVTEETITSAAQAQKLGLEVEDEDLAGLDEAIAVKAKKATVLISKEKGTTFYTVHDPFSDRTLRATSRDQAKHMAHGLLQENVTDTRFADYKVPGGENYRELLIRLPKLEGKYTSKHFQDQEIVHLRVDDRTGPNGEKVLFINEVQSDLHQQGRQKGYDADVRKQIESLRTKLEAIAAKKDTATDQEYGRFLDEENSLKQELASLEDRVSESFGRAHDRAVPNAPFKGDLWLELALKRALLYASENGYDAVSWARSDQIAKAVGAEPEKLALQYDSKIGKFLRDYTKKWGAKVEEEDLGIADAEGNHLDISLMTDEQIADAAASLHATNPILHITPQMRASVMEGQPLAYRGPQQQTPPGPATLHNTTLSSRAADRVASIRAEIDGLIEKMLPAGWKAEIRQSLVFGDLSERIQKRNPGVPPSLEIEGTFDPYEKIVYVSLAALDPVERAYEEAGHALKTLRLIPQSDYAILSAKAKEVGARQKFNIDERYGDLGRARWKDDPIRQEAALEEEAIMQMVAARARGDTFGRQSDAILDRLIKFLRSVRDMLGIKGFRSFEDVFEDMTEGGFARQIDAQRGGAGAGRPIGGEVMASIREPESPTATDASFIARANAASEIMFALGDEGKGKTPEAGGEAKPASEQASAAPSPSAPARTSAPILPGGRQSKRIRDLINQAAAEGKLPREDADFYIGRYDMLEQFYKDGGKAKTHIAKELSAEAEKRKANKDLAELKRRILVGFLTGVRDARGQADPAKAYQTLIENVGQLELPQGFVDVAGHQRAIYGLALAQLDAMLHEFKGVDFSPSGVKVALTGATRNKARLANVVRELHGEATGDELAAGFAQSAAKVMEDLRLRFNAAGGSIAKRKDWAMPQSHDKVALLKAQKDAWVEFITPLLDTKWMKHPLTGDDMPPADVRKTLGDVYDNLVSDGWHEREAEMVKRGLSAISNTRADPRALIFKDADAWMKYSARFGSGDDALAILISHIRGMTKDIAAMEVLGPNPTAMLEYIRQFVVQQASLRRAGMPAHFPTVREITGIEFRPGSKFRDPLAYANAMTKRAENMWRIYTGAASAPESPGWAEVSTTIKNVNVATKLGGAFVSGLGDPFWQIAARRFAGLPASKIIGDMVNQIKAGGERAARRSGIIAETFLHMHNEGAREGAAWSASKVSGYVADRVLTLSMLSSLTRAGNHAMSMGIQGHLADMAGKAFADLDPRLRRMFRRWGLEATDWDAIRLDAAGRVRDVDFLSPADIRRQLVDNGGDPSIAERYLGMTLGEAQYATLTGTITAQARVYGNMQAGTAQRELWSMFMQFKSFAVNLALLQISRMAREFVSQGFSRGAQYAALALGMATLGGALVEQLQQLRNGKDPRAMNTGEFWLAAAYRSGGMSIWGDLLYASENRFGGGVASTIAGPSAGTLNDILNLTYGSAKKSLLFTDDQQKTNFGRQLSSAVSRYTPGSSIWYVRAAWERALMDNLQRMLDPEADASFRRKIQNARRDYKQDFWWKPGGGFAPQRGPRLEAAFPAR
jgi:hypothetical protein